MKTKLLQIAFLFLSSFQFSFAQFQPAIVQDWADYIGYQDTIIRIPVIQDSLDHILTAGFTVDSITGPDIMVAKYKLTSELVWQRTYSSAGYNRDQATALAIDDSNNVYVAGSVFSSATNYDFVLLKYDTAGVLQWSSTYNGSANNYDVPSAIAVRDSFVYVTGAVNNTGTFLDFVTIQYNKYTGAQNWVRTYDYASLFDIPVAIEADGGGNVYVTGGSQQTLSDWDYLVLIYYSTGVSKDTLREEGTGNSFDRVTAVKNDDQGNFYLTGAAASVDDGFNIMTIKIDAGDTVAWIAEFNGDNDGDDEGNGIAIDNDGNVYVCGKTMNEDFDYILIKYDSLGNEVATQTYNSGFDDEATAICIDAFGNIVITGKAQHDGENYNFYTVAYDAGLEGELWHHSFDGAFNGDDYATGIAADDNGNIYVTGQSQINEDPTYEQVTIKYRTDYFVFPLDSVPPPTSLLFYPNYGQLLNDTGGLAETVNYYSTSQYPNIYIHTDGISFVLTKVDTVIATTDSLERIDMEFYGGSFYEDIPLQSNVHEDQQLNYFLGHCPSGITNIQGVEKLTRDYVYVETNVIISNNNAGMKFQIVCNTGSDPDEIQLHFTGHQQISIVGNSDLKIDGILGSFTYERPLVYQMDEEGNRISLGWLASYNIIDSANVTFTLNGDYDPEKPLVIECARFSSSSSYAHNNNLEWCTYFGGQNGEDNFVDLTVDIDHNIYAVGHSQSLFFPQAVGQIVIQSTLAGDFDAVLAKFDSACVLKWTTYLGGLIPAPAVGVPREFGSAVACDSNGDIFITGNSASADFPLQYQPGEFIDSTVDDGQIFISKISSSGSQLLWSTHFGDTFAWAEDMDIDANNSIFIVGTAQVALVPFPGAYNSSVGGAIIAGFDSTNNPFWVTHFGDQLYSVAVGKSDSIQNRVFVTGLTGNGHIPIVFPADSFCNGANDIAIACFYDNYNLNWSTYWGGSAEEIGLAIAVDNSTQQAYVGGFTYSSDFPCYKNPIYTNAFYDTVYQPNIYGANGGDGVILRFNATGVMEYATIYGDTGYNHCQSLTADNGMIYISGIASGGALPAPSPQPPFAYVSEFKDSSTFLTNYFEDAFILSINDSCELLWSTYFGDWGWNSINGLAYDYDKQKLYIAGQANELEPESPLLDFPWVEYDSTTGSLDYYRDGTNAYFDGCAYIARFDTRAISGVGITEPESKKVTFTVYPNPATDQLNILIDINDQVDINIEMYNSMGQLLVLDKIGTQQGKIQRNLDVSSLAKGIYLLTVRTKTSIESKIIILN